MVSRSLPTVVRRLLSSVPLVDRFALLQCERRYDVDLNLLQSRYKAMMAETHPDRHGRSSASEQQAAADSASEITDAYAVLRAPHQRAVHLLELLGAPLDEETGASVLDPTFLTEVMEMREELEEVASEPERLRTLRDTNTASMSALHSDLTFAFAVNNLEQARALTARLQYLNRIEEEIHARMPVS